MAGLVPAIHVFVATKEDVDARTSPGMTENAWLFAVYSALLTSLMRGSAFSVRLR